MYFDNFRKIESPVGINKYIGKNSKWNLNNSARTAQFFKIKFLIRKKFKIAF
jgi:hypothetical protein